MKVDLQSVEEDNIELRNQLEEMSSSTENEIETFVKGDLMMMSDCFAINYSHLMLG